MNRWRISFIVIALWACLSPAATLAITNEDLNSITSDTNFYNPDLQCATVAQGGGGIATTGKDNTMKVFNYFIPKGLSAIQVAGMIGNLMAESSLNPQAGQNGLISVYPVNGVGYGIAQWTFTVRQQPLVALAKQHTVAPNTLGVQLLYIWDELQGNPPAQDESKAYHDLKNSNTIAAATTVFELDYEGPQVNNTATRISFANTAYKEYQQVNNGGVITGGTGPGASATPAGACSGGDIVCNNSAPGSGTGTNTTGTNTGSADATRQNIVCVAQNELKLWRNGTLKPASGYLKYSQQRVEEWCADFSSWVYNQAGDPLAKPDWNVPAVVNVQADAQHGGADGRMSFHPFGSYTPNPGDLAIHGGNHVNIVVGRTGQNITLIGGDQGPPPYPGGSYVSQYSEPLSSAGVGDGITGWVSPD